MLTDRERSFASDLLRAAWTSDDAVIHDIIRKNKTHDPHPFEVFLSFFCVSQRGGVCDDCMEMPNFERIQHVRKEKMWSVGRIEMMEKVLQWYSKHGLHMAEFELDLYTLAVLHSMPQVIKLLDQYHVPETLTVKLSAMDFAKCLGYTECMEILSKTNHTCLGDTTDYSPLHEVQRLQENMQKPILIPVHLYMDALIRSGSCVNSEDPQGITPIQLAIQRGDYRSVRLLLMNGVNLFQGQTFLLEKGTTQLLLEIFYFNANIYDNLIQIIRSVVPESCDFGDDELVSRVFMYFIFHCVHSVSPKDEVHLNKTVPQNWFGVKSAQVSCRNVLRRHYGRCIHDFVQRFVKPKALKKFLLLIDHIEQLQDKLNWRYMKFNDSERY